MTLAHRAVIAGLALGIDALLGDPPSGYHPVAWMGRIIGWAQTWAPKQGRLAPLLYGATLTVTGAATAAAMGRWLESLLAGLPGGPRLVLEAALLKTALALRGLGHAADDVHAALARGDLDEARRLVGWHLVSRDTATLDAHQVSAATVESVAENTSDGIVAPLLYYAVGGLPGALAYRFVNTCDSMLGYRDAAREWLGKVPARLDDLANLVPARLTAALYIVAACLVGGDAGGVRRIWRRDAHATASPNAGHPMSAMAGALGVELEKVGHYRLGAGQRRPGPEDIARAIRLMRAAVALALGALLLVGLATKGKR